MNTFEITLDVDKRPNREVVVIRQDDRSGTTVRASLNDHGIRMDGGGYTARFCMTLPDRKTYYSDDAAYDSGVVTAVIDEQYAAQVPGTTKNAYFELYDGDELKYTTASFVVIVRPSALGGEAAKSYDSRVEEIMAELRAAIELCVPPVVEVVDGDGTHTVTITCPETTGTFTVLDGYSPTVSITDTADKHVITITDFSGEHSYEVPTYASEEAARVAAETARATAESLRASAESLRASAESGRVTSESDRASAESARRDAEVARASAETLRAEAETARESAETARASAESDRADAEADRVNAESDRRIFESARDDAETDRSVAEQSRVSAERSRSVAEQAREDAEQAREDAESDRASEWSTLRASAISATDSANTAASSARSAESDLRAAAARGDFDGYSPTVAIASTDTEHTVTITDAQGPHSYTVPTYSDEEQAREDAWTKLSQDAQEAIDAATAAAESVSDDVDALYNGIDMLRNDIRTAEVEGGIAITENAAKAVPVDLTVYGESQQDGTPTPDAPVDIVSAENPVLTFAQQLTLEQGGIVNGAETSNNKRVRTVSTMEVSSTLTLVGQCTAGTFNWGAAFYDASGTYLSATGQWQRSGASVTVPSGAVSARPYFRITEDANVTPSEFIAAISSTTATLPVTLRSLPDGTKDQLNLTYDRPSNRKGWAWYKAEVTRRCDVVTLDGSQSWRAGSGGGAGTYYSAFNVMERATDYSDKLMCDLLPVKPHFSDVANISAVTGFSGAGYGDSNWIYACAEGVTNATELQQWFAEHPTQLQYILATPTTETLPDIELPVLPLKETTVFCAAGSLQPEWHMTYQIDADAELVEVQERVDVLEVKTASMWGNRLTGELTGEVLTASDAYTAPPLTVGVQGKSEQVSYTGRNLVDPAKMANGYIANDGRVLGSTSVYKHNDYIPVTPGTTYTISQGGTAFSGSIRYVFYDADKQALSPYYTHESRASFQLTAPEGAAFFRGSFNGEQAKYAMFEEGSSYTGFEPYTGGKPSPSPDYPQEIVSVDALELELSGWNLFDISKVNTSVHTVTGTTIKAGSGSTAFTDFYTGLSVSSSRQYTAAEAANMLHLPAGTYTLKVSSASNAIECYYVDIYTLKTGKELVWNVTQKTFTLDKAGYVVISVRNAGSTVTDLQINAGTTALSYTPFTVGITTVPDLLPEGTSLRSLPDGTKDTLALTYLRPSTREGWAWYAGSVERAIAEIHYDSANTITVASSTGHKVLNKNLQGIYESTYTSNFHGNYLSNRFVGTSYGANYMHVGDGAYNGGSTCKAYLCVDENEIPDLATANAWLAENPTYIYLKLLEPTTETIDPIELPSVIGPSCTIYATADATPTLAVTYERDVTIAYNNLLAMVAELATS